MLKATLMISCASLLYCMSVHNQVDLPDNQNDIVVLGKRIIGLNIEYSLRGPFLDKCQVVPSSGDAKIDIAACGLVKICINRQNTIPDNIERCLNKILSDIKNGKSRLKLLTSPDIKQSLVDEAPLQSKPSETLAGQRSTPAAPPASSNGDILVVGKKQPKEGLWNFNTVTSVMLSPGMRSPSPQSRLQCIKPSEIETVLEKMLSSPEGGSQPGCHLRDLKISNGKFRASRVCLDRSGRTSALIDGLFNPESLEFRQDEERVDFRRQADGGSDRAITRLTTGRRVGDC